jgi:glycerophosphoryl diester phosphodiesterase
MPPASIIAHRGASAEAAENTRTAFIKALAHRADGIETDVQISADGIPVLWHDDDLAKIGLPGQRIEDLGFEALRSMDCTGWFAGAPSADPLPSLAEFLREFAPLARLLVEIKRRAGEPEQRQRLKVSRCLELAGPWRNAGPGIDFLSFDPASLVQVHEADPGWPCLLNSEQVRTAEAARRVFDRLPFLAGLCVPMKHLGPDLAEAVLGAGKRLAVYACDTEAEIERALDLRVSELITDFPGRARPRRDARRDSR